MPIGKHRGKHLNKLPGKFWGREKLQAPDTKKMSGKQKAQVRSVAQVGSAVRTEDRDTGKGEASNALHSA